MNEHILRSFHSNVRPFIKEVMVNGRIGIGAGNLRISDVQSGRPTIETSENGDRFKLSIPYAGQLISWGIVFNSYRPNFPPDFYFHDDSFLSDPEIDVLEENVPSLAKWNAEDPKSLLHVISELLALYRKHQMGRLSNSRESVRRQTRSLKADPQEQEHFLIQEVKSVDYKILIENASINWENEKQEMKSLKADSKVQVLCLNQEMESVNFEIEDQAKCPSYGKKQTKSSIPKTNNKKSSFLEEGCYLAVTDVQRKFLPLGKKETKSLNPNTSKQLAIREVYDETDEDKISNQIFTARQARLRGTSNRQKSSEIQEIVFGGGKRIKQCLRRNVAKQQVMDAVHEKKQCLKTNKESSEVKSHRKKQNCLNKLTINIAEERKFDHHSKSMGRKGKRKHS